LMKGGMRSSAAVEPFPGSPPGVLSQRAITL